MLFESEQGNITIAANGDCMLTRRLSVYREPGFLKLVELLKQCDVAFTNLEQLVLKDEGWPDEGKSGVAFPGDPQVVNELKWTGINLVSCANNHTYDYGIAGILATMKYLDQGGLVHAGTGNNLGEARAPAYLETGAGRVALVGLGTSTITSGRAGQVRPDFKGRPGLNTLRTQMINYVDRKSFDNIKNLAKDLGHEDLKENSLNFFPHLALKDTATEFNFLRNKFVLSDKSMIRYVPNEGDKQAIFRSIRDARRQADWVLVSIHWHDQEGRPHEPPEFLKAFAKECIDQGTDAFIAHGPHQLSGIEIYKGRPIFYSLGNFVCQLETKNFIHAERYDEVGLGWENTPADVYDLRTQKDTQGWVADPAYWESVSAIMRFKNWKLEAIDLYPLDFGFKGPRTQRGRPTIADPERGKEILTRLGKLSAPFGTKIDIRDGRGIIAL